MSDVRDLVRERYGRIASEAGGCCGGGSSCGSTTSLEIGDVESVTGWVYRTAGNAVTDYYRRRGAAFARAAEALAAEPLLVPEESAAEEELARCLRPLIAALPSTYGEALELTELAREDPGRGRGVARAFAIGDEVPRAAGTDEAQGSPAGLLPRGDRSARWGRRIRAPRSGSVPVYELRW